MTARGQDGATRKVSVRSRRRQQEKERLANQPFAVSPPPQLRRGPSVGWFGQLSTNCGMACGLLLFAVFLGCLPSVGGTATVPFSRTVVRGRHILTRKEYLDTFPGDTAGWAQYMEDQYFAERGVSLTDDAEERARDNPRETLGQARSRLFNDRVRSPNNRPTELSQAANQSRAQRKRESPEQRDKGKRDDRTRRQAKRARQAAARPARRASEILNGSLLVEGSDVGKLALTKEEQSTSTTCAGCGAELLPGEVTSSNPTYGSICCKKNKVSLPPICTPCPEVTKLWHDADGVVGKTLRKFARAINNTLAFASQKVKRPNNLPGSSTWSPTVVIQGRVHHFIGDKTYGRQDYAEVAVLKPDADENGRDIVVKMRGGALKTINETHRGYDPLHFVILHPAGDDGWKIGMTKTGSKQSISPCDFYAYREYVCSAFAKAEHCRLQWQRHNQTTIRAVLYQNLVDHVAAGDAGKKIGKRVVLSSSFVGGNRDLHRRYQDAMAVVRAHGKPSFFITFTCNPNWPEIVNSLPKGLKACDRPDIVSRVFRQKLNELLTDIKEKAIFGTANANLSVTEFQKRGLPHGHILCILDSQFRLTCADEIDDTVLAEIPPLPVGPRPNDDEQAKAYDQAVRLHEAGGSSGDECGSAAAEAASDSESESSLLEQAIRAAGDVCGPSTSAVETGNSLEAGNSSDEDASHCETLGADDSSDASYTDGDSSSIDSDVGGASDEDSDASWLPSD
ncbi:hypothetical protein EMIHUDRAFT_195723 [Emiliania huxleyi CCMP1516]|uniref:Helitron helicase-like domain-containing protein n=2 Tax=Emiliania huxleyi TaxID=2903 RepID=A0A0D3JHZ1_EMIH1|nr:hypothetical protein EMIHUDRAFT_195723 [Emiliania huxleyi CCMP1516]EOD23126.1 hypothetical protein EMIHUDRAFT_195723 [Emiliania huxleyi CCMP1516]|eukprot:XP_005775555.1 hypothetical protein EMIHUDRAFT_195723 [Emiliania huxleyi CCMP1516]